VRKVLVSISTVAVVGIGGLLGFSVINDDKPEQADTLEKTDVVSATNEDEEINLESEVAEEQQEEVIEIPTTRTNSTNSNYPWEFYSRDKIRSLQNAGETVYLYSDAEAVENMIVEQANFEVPENAPISKAEMDVQSADYLDLFINEISQIIDNQAYFDKLNEAKQELLNGNYSAVPTLINEAKTLRES
jgi:hypothetical protein